MIYAKVGDNAIVYTGDYNMTPDRHLGAAHIDRLELDLLITEYEDENYFFFSQACYISPNFCHGSMIYVMHRGMFQVDFL